MKITFDSTRKLPIGSHHGATYNTYAVNPFLVSLDSGAHCL